MHLRVAILPVHTPSIHQVHLPPLVWTGLMYNPVTHSNTTLLILTISITDQRDQSTSWPRRRWTRGTDSSSHRSCILLTAAAARSSTAVLSRWEASRDLRKEKAGQVSSVRYMYYFRTRVKKNSNTIGLGSACNYLHPWWKSGFIAASILTIDDLLQKKRRPMIWNQRLDDPAEIATVSSTKSCAC